LSRCFDAAVRTTLTLDPDVSAKLHSEFARSDRAFKTAVNEALRRGLGGAERPAKRTAYAVKPLRLAFRPGIDTDKLNELADELEDAGVVKKYAR